MLSHFSQQSYPYENYYSALFSRRLLLRTSLSFDGNLHILGRGRSGYGPVACRANGIRMDIIAAKVADKT
jgi:hypothetical protein